MQRPTRLALVALVAGSALLPLAAHAQVTDFALFRLQYYQQTGDPNIPGSLTLFDADFNARIFTQHPGDVAAAALTYPDGMGGSKTVPLTQEPTIPIYGTPFDYGSGNLGTASAVDAAYPAGDFTVNYSGGTLGSGSATTTYTGTDAYSNVPAFTLAGYNALQNLNSAQSQTLGIIPEMTNPNANTHLLFFTVYDVNTGSIVYSTSQFVDPNAPPTSVFLPGGTLMADTAYVTDLDYSERIDAVDPNTNILTEQGFDQRSEADFTTAPAAVPEASTTVSFGLILLLGLGGIVIAAKRRRASSAV